jgi:hypothetical protein
MSNDSTTDSQVIGILRGDIESTLTRDLSEVSGVLIEAEQAENDELVVSDLEETGENGVESEEEEELSGVGSETLANSNTDNRTKTSITDLLNLLDIDIFVGVVPQEETLIISPRMATNSRFHATARSGVEKVVVDVVKKTEERKMMTAKEKAKLREDTVRGLETKFEMSEQFSQTDSIEHLKTINDVALMIGDVTKRLKQYDMMDVSELHLPSAADPTTARKTVDLITKYATATLEEVCKFVECYRTSGLD